MNWTQIFCITLAAVSVFLSASIVMWYRSHMKKLMKRLSNMIDGAMNSEYSRISFDESMVSSLEWKMNQFLETSLASRNHSLSEKEFIKSMISDIAHQTKTPLANILLFSSILEERMEISRENAQLINNIHQQADKLNFLITALIKTSRLETGLISVTPKVNEVDSLLQSVCNELHAKAAQRNIRIRRSDSGLWAMFDGKWTMEALCNILDNAIKYSPADSEITVSVQELEVFCRIDIKDNGIGIREQEQGRIFERFYRSPDVDEFEGVGIGLYLSREIISAQKGYMKVTSKRKEGSVFAVYLPKDS